VIDSLAFLLLAASQPDAADPPACTAARARRATVAAIARRPAQFAGQCVTVSGYVSGHSLQSLAGETPAGSPLEVGLVGGATRYAGPVRGPVTVTGTVDTCLHMRLRAEARRSPSQPIVYLRGYCHRASGPVVRVEDFRVE
jgi:hypothetical protein